jgi:alpha-1,3-glucosyltransferase
MAFLFSVLIWMKHLFAPLALPVGVYLLRVYCVDNGSFNVTRLLGLAAIAAGVSVIAIGPFVFGADAMDQLLQIKKQLLPFDRGLVHTYWAPNFWALYCLLDRVLVFSCAEAEPTGTIGVFRQVLRSLLMSTISCENRALNAVSSTTGVLGSTSTFVYMPSVNASVCLIITIAAMVPAVVSIIRTPEPKTFLFSMIYCSLCSFMFGYHVHEKAILIPCILSCLALASSGRSVLVQTCFFLLSSFSVLSLLPLFTGAAELPIKIVFHVLNAFLTLYFIEEVDENQDSMMR